MTQKQVDTLDLGMLEINAACDKIAKLREDYNGNFEHLSMGDIRCLISDIRMAATSLTTQLIITK